MAPRATHDSCIYPRWAGGMCVGPIYRYRRRSPMWRLNSRRSSAEPGGTSSSYSRKISPLVTTLASERIKITYSLRCFDVSPSSDFWPTFSGVPTNKPQQFGGTKGINSCPRRHSCPPRTLPSTPTDGVLHPVSARGRLFVGCPVVYDIFSRNLPLPLPSGVASTTSPSLRFAPTHPKPARKAPVWKNDTLSHDHLAGGPEFLESMAGVSGLWETRLLLTSPPHVYGFGVFYHQIVYGVFTYKEHAGRLRLWHVLKRGQLSHS